MYQKMTYQIPTTDTLQSNQGTPANIKSLHKIHHQKIQTRAGKFFETSTPDKPTRQTQPHSALDPDKTPNCHRTNLYRSHTKPHLTSTLPPSLPPEPQNILHRNAFKVHTPRNRLHSQRHGPPPQKKTRSKRQSQAPQG